jgi:hypothetical protein
MQQRARQQVDCPAAPGRKLVGDGEAKARAADTLGARWRASAYLAVSGKGAAFRSVFKARTAGSSDVGYVDPDVGIYLSHGHGQSQLKTVVNTTMNGRVLDPEAPVDSRILEVGIEREGLRDHWFAINAKMGYEGGEEDDDMAGVYITNLQRLE